MRKAGKELSLKIKADLGLLFVTLTWGISFILTQNAIASIPVFNFLAVRFTIAFVLSGLFFYKRMMQIDKETVKYGLIVGGILFSGYAVQTIGLLYISSSKSAFITGLNVVLVPVISAIILKETIKVEAKIGVFLAFVGLGFLTLNGLSLPNIGDLLTLIAAFSFAFHIITVGHFTKKVASLEFGIMQIGGVALFSWIMSFMLETPSLSFSFGSWMNMLFLGVFCTSMAFIVQSIAQQFTTSTHTALIYTNEPVFAGIFGYLIAGDILGVNGVFGGALILSGMILAEIDVGRMLRLRRA